MATMDALRVLCKERGITQILYGAQPRLIIVGETHDHPAHLENERSIVQLLQPEFVLHEALGGRTYDPETQETKFLQGVPHDRYDDMVRDDIPSTLRNLFDDFGVPIIGMDLTNAELAPIVKLVKRTRRSKQDVTSHSNEILPYRESRMAARMIEYSSRTSGPLVAIMGNFHRRPTSAIHGPLREAVLTIGLDYMCIYQPKSSSQP